MLIHAQLVEAREDCRRYRRSPSKSAFTHQNLKFEGVCTYPDPLFICPCRSDGAISRLLCGSWGANLALVPYAQLFNWLCEWSNHYEDQEHFKMKLIVAHGKYAAKYPLKDAYKADLAGTRATSDSDDEQNPDRALSAAENHYVYRASRKAHLYFILSTPDSFDAHCDRHIVETRTWTRTIGGKRPTQQPQKQFLSCLVAALIAVDESHKFKSIDVQPWRLIENLKLRMNDTGIPRLVAMTGTPFVTGPENLLGIVNALTDPNAMKGEENPRDLTIDDLKKYAADFKEYSVSVTKGRGIDQPKMNELMRRLGNHMQPLILRRTKRSRWFDLPILNLPPCTMKTVNVPFPLSYRKLYDHVRDTFRNSMMSQLEEAQQSWYLKSEKERKASSKPTKINTMFMKSLSRQLRIAATIPWVLEYWTKNGTDERFLVGSFSDWLLSNGRMNAECPLRPCVQAAKQFTKFQALDAMLKIVFEKREKFLIITEFLCVATVVNEVRMQCMHDPSCCHLYDLLSVANVCSPSILILILNTR